MTNHIEEKSISKDDEQSGIYCTFCTKSSLDVKVIISAPDGKAYICGSCVDVCVGFIEHWKKMQEDS